RLGRQLAERSHRLVADQFGGYARGRDRRATAVGLESSLPHQIALDAEVETREIPAAWIFALSDRVRAPPHPDVPGCAEVVQEGLAVHRFVGGPAVRRLPQAAPAGDMARIFRTSGARTSRT